ncbi:MAG: hypothetical protein H0T65_08230, partial [Deltaproteobacteria bacterium]|nr:hypothetical protein [Deltaproteobacteria bacterium]
MTPPPEDDPPPPKRRRRPPPKGLEGFDTGYPEETEEPSPSGGVRKPIWTDSAPVAAPSEPVPEAAPAPEASVVVDSSMAAPGPTDAAAGGAYGGSYGGNYGGSASGAYGSNYGGHYGATDPSTFPALAPAAASGPITAATLDRDEPLSAAASDPDLREAVGAKAKKKKSKRARTPDIVHSGFDEDDDELGGGRRRSRKMIVVAIISLVVGLGVAALIFLGRTNSAWFYLSCEADKIVAQQGRSFPPWGESERGGKQWAAIKIPPEAEC